MLGKYNSLICAVYDEGCLRVFVGPASVDLYRWGAAIHIDRTGAWREA